MLVKKELYKNLIENLKKKDDTELLPIRRSILHPIIKNTI